MNIRLRHDAIVRILRRNGSSTVNDLAEEVGASRRTVLRDIGALRDQGFLIHSESGRGGGLQLDPESVQTTTRLSVIEVFALLISVAAVRAARSLPFSDLADAGLAKIERALSADKVRDLRRLLDCLYVGQLSPRQDVSDIGSIDPGCCRPSRRHFSSGCIFGSATVTPRGWKHCARSNRRPCSSCRHFGISSPGMPPARISATFAWTGSASRRLWRARSFVEGTYLSKMMFALSAKWHARLRTHLPSQKMTVAAMQMALKKAGAERS